MVSLGTQPILGSIGMERIRISSARDALNHRTGRLWSATACGTEKGED